MRALKHKFVAANELKKLGKINKHYPRQDESLYGTLYDFDSDSGEQIHIYDSTTDAGMQLERESLLNRIRKQFARIF
ncbi:MAG: hypothetical protein PHU71_01525 [Candidatus Gracilibacteria bacterium]|nr:hypothetical protein [Candidatus Gracilibacteria bacterium]